MANYERVDQIGEEQHARSQERDEGLSTGRDEPAAPVRQLPPSKRAKDRRDEHQRGERLRREQELERQDECERDHEPPSARLASQPPYDQEGSERHEEDQRHMQMTDRLIHLEHGEAEDPAADQRRPEATDQVAAQEERAPSRERRSG